MYTLIINIEDSPLRNRRFRIYLLNGNHYDVGFKKCKYYIDNHNKLRRDLYYGLLNNDAKNTLMTLKPSQLLYETFILNGGSKNIINNINYFNKEIQKLIV
jgi:hypothetical protein